MSSNNKSLSYKAAGVNIAAGDALVEKIKPYVKRTRRPEWLGGLGGFGALFEVPTDRYKHPVLVSGTDGVGTKLKLAQLLNIHDTIGIDLVAMCANDILASGAEPLFFLDYYASGKLDVETAAEVIKGIARGCEISGMSLIGGETAEMPGMYDKDEYDLAGFCVGVVEKENIISGTQITPGNSVIALASTGPHSNGYSLIRKIIQTSNANLNLPVGDSNLSAALMMPTRLYTQSVLKLLKQVRVNGIAHITGGGIEGNLVRVLPQNTMAKINKSSWEMPAVFKWLAHAGNVAESEMYKTFNCGVGLMLIVDAHMKQKTLSLLNESGETAWHAGSIESHDGLPVVALK